MIICGSITFGFPASSDASASSSTKPHRGGFRRFGGRRLGDALAAEDDAILATAPGGCPFQSRTLETSNFHACHVPSGSAFRARSCRQAGCGAARAQAWRVGALR